MLTEALQTLAAIENETHRHGARQQLTDLTAQAGRYDSAVQVAESLQPEEEFPVDRVELLLQLFSQSVKTTETRERFRASMGAN